MTDKFSIEQAILCLLTVFMLLTLGPVSALWPKIYYDWWPGVVLLLSIGLSFGGMFFLNRHIGDRLRLFVCLCVIYGAMVLIVGGMHVAEHSSINQYTIVNTVGEIVQKIKEQALTSTCQYLLFPTFLILQILLWGRVKFLQVAIFTVCCVAINLAVVYYQGFVDYRFLNNWHPEKHQVNGLCADPNTLSMSLYLLIVFFLSASFLVNKGSFKKLFAVIIVLLIGAMAFAGGRSMPGGLFIFIVLSPLIIALGYSNWPARKRIIFGSLSLVFLICSIVCIPLFIKSVENLGKAGERLASTYYKYEQNGISALIDKDEMRGELFSAGISLIKRAPMAGWGPGGYYREFSNQIYLDTGIIKPAPDMVLNHYLMIAVDFGLPLAIFNLSLMLLPIILAGYCLKHEEDIRQRLGILILIFGNCVFMLMINMMPPSYFSEVIWLWTGQLAFLVLYAGRSIRLNKISLAGIRKPLIYSACIGVGLTVFGAYQTSFGQAGYAARKDSPGWPLPPYDYNWGCYPPDTLSDGSKGRWCGKESIVQIPITSSHVGKEVTVVIDNQYPDLRGKPVVLQYGGKAGVHSTVLLTEKGKKEVTVSLDENHFYSYRLKNGEEMKFLVLSLNPSRTWSPSDYGVADNRRLGVLVLLSKLKNN